MFKLPVDRKEENEALLKFIAGECEAAEEPINILDKIREFIGIRGSETNAETLRTVVIRYKPKVREIKDEGKRARQLFCLGVPVDDELMKKLQKCAHVTLDGNQKIVKYVSHDGSLTLEGDQSKSAKIKNALAEKRKSQMITMDNGAEKEEDDDAPETSSPKKQRVSVPIRDSGSSSAGSSASQRLTPSNSVPQTSSAMEQRGNSNAPANRPAVSSARQMRQSERALNPSGVSYDTPKADENRNVAPGQDHIKIENPEVQNIFEPNEVKPEIRDYHQPQQPPRNGVLFPAAQKSFIDNMQTLISSQKLPINPRVVLKLGKAGESIERVLNFGAPNPNEIPVEDFVTAIQHTLLVARRNSFDSPAEDSRSLQNFLVCLHFSIAGLRMEELKALEAKLVETIEDSGTLNKRIPIDRIGNVMHSILDLLVPN